MSSSRRREHLDLAIKALGILMVIGFLAAGPGCGHWQYDQFPAPSWNPKGLATPMITDQERIFVHPDGMGLKARRAGLMTFRTNVAITELGPSITEIFYRELLAKRVFADLVMLPETYTRMDEALRLAKHYKVDVLVVGEVPYYLDGGTVGNSALQVDLKVIEAGSGRLLWSFRDSLKATRRPVIGLIVVETRPYPTPAMGNLTAQLAERMAETLERGTPPPAATGIAAWFLPD
jgi:hypothetical protein